MQTGENNGRIVEVRDLRRVYRQGKVEVPALRGVSTTIDRGEFTALVGPSGSGKTTLLNLIGGLDASDGGEVTVAGHRIDRMKPAEVTRLRLERIGFVFQSYNLIPVLSALENVEYILLLQGVPKVERRRRAAAVLDEVGLAGMHGRRPAELSGGQQQRVAIARAIASRPAIVLADEPTANLDSQTARELLEMMREMNARHGTTFVFATHDELVMNFARRIIRLRDGEIVADERRDG
ncbi:MAG: ABC transporter ATP-binding protein [Verrucomicrobia bacterium]|nr:MAG: ABC transporter ATP-binding protein [Verrucomicrobiota bacterium]